MSRKATARWIRFGLLTGAVLTLAFWLRGRDRYTIPDTDESLAPFYAGGSTLLTDPLGPHDPLPRGSDVVYWMEEGGMRYARFGRVSGLPGDRVESVEGRLLVNGEALSVGGELAGTVPPGRLLILATNPLEKRYPDSRRLGYIPRGQVAAIIRAALSLKR
ncbi:MAG: hypothetical protein ACT4PV_04285 [Planctomycetaceae bacterium]